MTSPAVDSGALDVRVVGPDAFSESMTGAQRVRMGYAVLDPGGGKTGVHHHGDTETAVYIVSGRTRWWVGDRLDDVREAHAGDFVFIPPCILHWKQNASDTEPVDMIVARGPQEAIVVPVEDHPDAPPEACARGFSHVGRFSTRSEEGRGLVRFGSRLPRAAA
jgi:uncharacterized RmlC-like cupin family protein